MLKIVGALLLAAVTALPLEKGPKKVLGSEHAQNKIANTTDLASPGWDDTYECKGWCSKADSPHSWAAKCTWDLHCAACDECKPLQQCKDKCKNLATTTSWADICAWPQGKNCHGCADCPTDTHPDMDWPSDQPLECTACDNNFKCGVCLMEIPADECLATLPVGTGSDNYCTGPAGTGSAVQVHMGELCAERSNQCGTHGSLNNCPVMNGVAGSHYQGIYRRVECVEPNPPPASPPPSSPPASPPAIPCDQCTNDYSVCNVCMVAIKASECPVGYESLQQCTPALTALGQLCEGDGECGTSDAHAQCGAYEVYRRVECIPPPASPPPSIPSPSPPPAPLIPCDQCTNDYSVCNVCMVTIKASECPVGYQSLQQCTPALTALGQLCEGDGECGTSDAHAQCGDYEVYKHVECVQPPPPPAAPPLSCTACDNNNECGICLTAIPASECPANPNLHQCKADLVSMNGLCEGDGECGTNNNHNQCSGAYEVYRQVDCRPPHAKLTFHTCNVDYADSDKPIYYQADGGSLVELDNTGDDREKNQDDEYSVNWAKNTFSIITSSDDGWCIDKITYGSLSVDLSNQQKSGVWLDKPCSGWDYDRPCTSKITIDVNTGAVQQHHEQGGILPLDLPFLKVHTCNVGNANSDDPIYYSASPAFSQSSHASLDRYGHDDRKKNYFDTYYNLKPASNAFNLAAVDTDGWCVDSIEYVWASQNIKMKADLSCTRDKSLWLDGPCTETDYNGVPCAQNIIVSVIDGDVKMMGVKGQPASMTKDLGSCSACLTKDDCGTAASSMGLTLGGKGYSFDGNYNTKGCYYYPDGTYKGRAYFGTGGTDASMGAAPGNAAQERVACPA